MRQVSATAVMRASTLLVAIVLSCSSLAPAGQVKPASPAKAEAPTQGYIIESLKTSVRFEADGKSSTVVTARVHMLSEAAVQQFGLLTFSYTSANQQLEIDYVRVLKPDGSVIETPLAAAQDMSAPVTRIAPMFSDLMQRDVPIKGLAVGDRVEYKSEVTQTAPLIPDEFWYDYTFSHDGTVKKESLEVSMPEKKYVQVKSPDLKPVTTREGHEIQYRWTSVNPGAEAQVQAGADSFPTVQITTFRTWLEVGRWWGGLEAAAATPTPDVRAKAAELTRGLKTEQDKLSAIYHYVSTQFRYISLSFGIGRYEPHTASAVLNNLYGDCKDKDTLLASLLEAAGIHAYSALINSARKIDPDVPSPGQFDHVITAVPQSSDNLLWLDATEEVAPLGFLERGLRDKQALLIPPGGNPYLVKTPADPPFASFQAFVSKGALSDDGTYTGKMRMVARNDYGFALRVLFFLAPQARWQQLVQGISRFSGYGGDVSNVQAADPADTEKPFEYSYDYTRKNYSDWANHRIFPAMSAIRLADWTDGDAKAKKPLELGSPDHITQQSSMSLPPDLTPTLPPAVKISRDFAEYDATYSFKAGVFYAERDFIVKQREIPFAQKEVYGAFKKAVEENEYKLIPLVTPATAAATAGTTARPLDRSVQKLLQQAQQALSEQDLSDGLDDLHRAANAAPKSAYVWGWLGAVQLATNDQNGGEASLRKAIALAPKDPRGYSVLAAYFSRTRQYEDAIRVWRDLLNQVPDNVPAHAMLGWLLLNEKKYDESAAQFEAVAKQNSQNKTFELELGQAELGAGKPKEGVAALEAAVKLDPSPATLSSAAAYLADRDVDLAEAQVYAEKAVAETEIETAKINLDQLQESDLSLMNQVCTTWDALGWTYFQQGKLLEAEKYIESAWMLGEHMALGDHLGRVYERLGRRQEAIRAYSMASAAIDVPYGKDDPNLVRLLPQRSQRDAAVSRARAEDNRLRHIRLGKISSFEGSAEFWVLFGAAGKIISVRFASGAVQLRPEAKYIAASRLHELVPDSSPTKIVRRGVVVCEGPSLGCDFTLLDLASTHLTN